MSRWQCMSGEYVELAQRPWVGSFRSVGVSTHEAGVPSVRTTYIHVSLRWAVDRDAQVGWP
jgi:hypothetical protein